MNKINNKQGGFTLVELAIVLVIIGLIVGGVLTGQELINQAKIRAQINQLNQFDAAVNTFRAKYNGLPGDLADGDDFGLVATANIGNGNGIISGLPTTATNEAANVFLSLSTGTTAGSGPNLIPGTFAVREIPASRLERGSIAIVTDSASEGVNYYVTTVGGAAGTAGGTLAATGTALSVIEAFSIDQKLDDGLPNVGNVQAELQGAVANVFSAAPNTGCTAAHAATDVYVLSAGGAARVCPLRIRVNG